MPAKRTKKVVKKPKRIRPKFTLKGVKKDTIGKAEENREPEGDLAPVVQSPTPSSPGSIGVPEPTPQEPATDAQQPFIPVSSSPTTVQPPQTQFSPSPPPSQFVVAGSPVEDSSSTPQVALTQPPPEKPIIETVSTKEKKSWVFPVILFLIFLLGLGGGLFYFFFFLNGDIKKLPLTPPIANNITNTPSPSEAVVTEVPKVNVNLSEYEIRVLNGSGIAGEAGKVESLLNKEGFVVSGTGNAKQYDYEETVIQARSGVKKDFIDKLINVLEQSYVVASETASLAGENVDVIVIVGSNKVE